MEESKTYENVLIIDTEGNHELREIGAILWNLRTNETVEFSSHLPHTTDKINEFKNLVEKCDGIIGHHIGHDKLILKHNHLNVYHKISICSCQNFKWPDSIKSIRLESICEYFNIETIGRHTAIGDARLLKQCLIQVPGYHSRLQHAFKEKNKQHKIFQLIHPETKLVEFKKGQNVIAQFLNSHCALYKYEEKYCTDGVIIPCPTTIQINTKRQKTENVEKLLWYITNEYPILVKRVRIRQHPHVLFVIGAKHNDSSRIVDVNEMDEQPQVTQHIFKSRPKRGGLWKTIHLLSPDAKITTCKQNDNVIARFRWRSNGYFQKCRYHNYNDASVKVLSTVQFPETIEILDNAININNVEKMKTYIATHPIRVNRIQGKNREYGILFSIGEPILKPHDMESKSESFQIQNQTDLNDGLFLQYLDENKYLLTCLQENKLRFAPICLNNTNFILNWNATTSTLEIVHDQS